MTFKEKVQKVVMEMDEQKGGKYLDRVREEVHDQLLKDLKLHVDESERRIMTGLQNWADKVNDYIAKKVSDAVDKKMKEVSE